mmetsp:Transcript_70169/g.120510  ORF Transcript_70169/g.120510 Transcript_70169/m.120510 type:complete len:99 (-) Transcript_70169:36-332(-)
MVREFPAGRNVINPGDSLKEATLPPATTFHGSKTTLFPTPPKNECDATANLLLAASLRSFSTSSILRTTHEAFILAMTRNSALSPIPTADITGAEISK